MCIHQWHILKHIQILRLIDKLLHTPIILQRIEAHTIFSLNIPVLDVRSPGEFNHAHIPGAYSLPLFTDEERKIVGTIYKQKGKQLAIKQGLTFFRMKEMVEQVEQLMSTHFPTGTTPEVLVHCWRGGMRSAAVAWLLQLYGFKVHVLEGGYKAFRNAVLSTFEQPFSFNILGGFTGSGKTDILTELQANGEQIINLEAIANHRGSAFGGINQPPQPSQEMFENLLATQLHQLNIQSHIWLEDESQRIGVLNIPHALWKNMRKSPVYFVDKPFQVRLESVVQSYGQLNVVKLIEAVVRIQKRLGPVETRTTLQWLQEENIPEAFTILLKYYDKYYMKGLNNREEVNKLIKKFYFTNESPTVICKTLKT